MLRERETKFVRESLGLFPRYTPGPHTRFSIHSLPYLKYPVRVYRFANGQDSAGARRTDKDR